MNAGAKSTLGRIPSDISSEIIHSLLPLFMVATLGASALVVLSLRAAGLSASRAG
jgi:hypothetical protein